MRLLVFTIVRLVSLFSLLLALVSVGARGGEFEQFERNATAVRLLCIYQGNYQNSYRDHHAMWWVYDGKDLVMNGQPIESDLFRAQGNSIIVDFSKLVEKADLFSPNEGIPFFLNRKYYVNFEKMHSVLAIGDRFTIRGQCEVF